MAKRSTRLVAVVTGANKGIGLELVKQLAQLRLTCRPVLQPEFTIDGDDHDHARDKEYEEGGGEEEEQGRSTEAAAAVEEGINNDADNRGAPYLGSAHLPYLKMEVVLTARNPELGREAMASLSASNHGDHHTNVHFHQLDVTCPRSVSALASWLRLRFGRLDLLINNAGLLGATMDMDYIQNNNLTALEIRKSVLHQVKAIRVDLDQQRNCIETNYFGVKRMIQAMLPLLSKSKRGGQIINISSSAGKLENLPNETLRKKLSQIETLEEINVDDFVGKFLEDLNMDFLPSNPEEVDMKNPSLSWPLVLPGYRVSKIALNAYTRVLSRNLAKQGQYGITVNVVHPGFVKTDMVSNMGEFSIIEATQSIIWLANLPHPRPSGQFFFQKQPYEF